MPALSYSSNTLGNLTAKQAMSPRGVTQPTAFVLSCTLLSLHPTDSLDKVRELVRERATSLVSASRPREAPTPSAPVTTTPSHFPSQILPTILCEAEKCDAGSAEATNTSRETEEAEKYIRSGKCRRDVFGKIVLPSGARVPRSVKGGSLRDWLEEYYEQSQDRNAAQVSVEDITRLRRPATRDAKGAVFQDTKATATENRGPVLPSDIAKKAIEPPDDYQTPQTTILSNPESRVAPASVADTVNGPASNSPTSVCDLADSRAEASVLPTVSHSPIVSRSLSDLESSVFGLPSVPSPEQPQLRVTQAIESWPRWPQNRFIVPTSLHIARQLERVWHVFPRYFQFPLPSAGGVANCTPINVTLPPSVTVSITPDPPSVCEAVRTPVCVSVLPSVRFSGPEQPQLRVTLNAIGIHIRQPRWRMSHVHNDLRLLPPSFWSPVGPSDWSRCERPEPRNDLEGLSIQHLVRAMALHWRFYPRKPPDAAAMIAGCRHDVRPPSIFDLTSASHSVPLVPSSVPPCVSISPSRGVSLSSDPDPSRDSSYISPSVLGSVPVSPSVDDLISLIPSSMRCSGPEWPQQVSMQSQVGHDGRKLVLASPSGAS
ncbi:hypothetical protein EDB84DRAFT_1632705 [Lactarius hengduanensis]|nr:hypothetical protein EDB84DRAFT_1632705 [Lactarius hengduanensis]